MIYKYNQYKLTSFIRNIGYRIIKNKIIIF